MNPMEVVGPGDLSEARVKDLMNQGFSLGLIKALKTNKGCFHYRIWIVDNSGSMAIGDGRTFALTSKGKIEARYVTRWEEIQETVLYHAELAGTLGITTNFRLLNPINDEPDEFTVFASGADGVNQELRQGRNVINRAKPFGVTPLTAHILHIEEQIQEIADDLRARGQRITVVLATDGLPTDENGDESEEVFQDFIAALRMLEGLPVWVVIRLCTNEKKVTEFYNQIDEVLEFNLEVLDDYLDEAKEVYKFNKWLNYALPMHRCRELGYHDRLFDLLDERKLMIDELRSFFSLLFGTEQHRIPDPTVEWKAFLQFVEDALEYEKVQWDPIKKKSLPWVNVKFPESLAAAPSVLSRKSSGIFSSVHLHNDLPNLKDVFEFLHKKGKGQVTAERVTTTTNFRGGNDTQSRQLKVNARPGHVRPPHSQRLLTGTRPPSQGRTTRPPSHASGTSRPPHAKASRNPSPAKTPKSTHVKAPTSTFSQAKPTEPLLSLTSSASHNAGPPPPAKSNAEEESTVTTLPEEDLELPEISTTVAPSDGDEDENLESPSGYSFGIGDSGNTKSGEQENETKSTVESEVDTDSTFDELNEEGDNTAVEEKNEQLEEEQDVVDPYDPNEESEWEEGENEIQDPQEEYDESEWEDEDEEQQDIDEDPQEEYDESEWEEEEEQQEINEEETQEEYDESEWEDEENDEVLKKPKSENNDPEQDELEYENDVDPESKSEELETTAPYTSPEAFETKAPYLPNDHKEVVTKAPYVPKKDETVDEIVTSEDVEIVEMEEELEEAEEELEEEEREVRRIGGFGVVLAVVAMVFTAYQMSENPDGIYASFCRLIITVSGCVVKMMFVPFRSGGHGGGGRGYGHIPAGSDYRDPYRPGAGSLELS